jgi:protein phosphatase 2C family protein 2/3
MMDTVVNYFFLCRSFPQVLILTGNFVAKFAAEHLHKRLVSEETYREKRYDEALKKAFLGTDEDLRAGALHCLTVSAHSTDGGLDPSSTSNAVLGCTAVAALLTHENKIYVVRLLFSRISVLSDDFLTGQRW